MKILILTIIAMFTITSMVTAQAIETITVKVGQQKTSKKSKLKIKFVSVVEDSRCPIGVNCVWAGNAKIKIEVTSRGLGKKVFEINTTMGPQGDQFDGWAINLVALTPHPKADTTLDPKDYRAKFSLTRLQR